MSEVLSVKEQAFYAGIFSIISLIMLLLGWRFGFFIKLPNEKEPSPIQLRDVLGAFIIYFFFSIFFTMLLVAFYKWKGDLSGLLQTEPEGWLRTGAMLAGALAVFIYAGKLGKEKWQAIWHRLSDGHSNWHSCLIGAAACAIAYPLVIALSSLQAAVMAYLTSEPVMLEQNPVLYLRSLREYPFLFGATVLTFGFLTPAAEELLFRGFLQSRFREYLSTWPAIILTSCFFAALHLSYSQGWSNIIIFSSIFLLALFLGYLYERQRNLWASISLHVVFNLINISLILLS